MKTPRKNRLFNPMRSRAFYPGLLLCLWASSNTAAPAQQLDLQMLVDQAAAGDTLYLEAAHYTGAQIDKPLTLIGQGSETVLDAGGSGHALAINAPDCEIRRVRITGSGTDIDRKESGIWVDRRAPRVRLHNVQVEACNFGIWVDAANAPEITHCQIIGRTDAPIISDLGNGIHLFNVSGGIIADNTVMYGRDGIYISNSTGCRIQANRIRHTRFAIHYMYSHTNQVLDNQADSSSVGIALMYSKHLQIRGNQVHNCHTHGILLRNLYYSYIASNTSTHNQDGFAFSGCNYDTLAANLAADNTVGMLVSDSEDNVVTGNAFINNVEQLNFQANISQSWGAKAGGNYWSDYMGWDRDNDGVGDRKHYPTDIASYLVYRFPAVRLVMHSPAMKLLQELEAQFPVIRPPGVVELRPLMHNPLVLKTNRSD